MTEPEDTATAMVEWIAGRSGTSFVEILNWMSRRGIEPHGDQELYFQHPNLILWTGMSDEACQIFLLARKRIEPTGLTPTEAIIVYGYDGGWMNLPIAINPPSKGYKEPHWAPVVFNGPSTEDLHQQKKPTTKEKT